MENIKNIISVSIKWSELINNKVIIKAMDFKTLLELKKFRTLLIKSTNFYKIIGESWNVEYIDGYDPYWDC